MTKSDSISYRISGELKTGGWCVADILHRGATLEQAEKKLHQIARDHNGSINYTGKFRLEKLTTSISTVKAVENKHLAGYECDYCCAALVSGPGEICQSCEAHKKSCFAKIDKLKADGHSYYCARRQVYGDGWCECECGVKNE